MGKCQRIRREGRVDLDRHLFFKIGEEGGEMMKKYIVLAFLILFPSYVLATPMIDEISAVYSSDFLIFTAVYDSPDNDFDPWTPGGWCFQIFLDTDQDDSTGYSGSGFDFTVRAVEQETDGSIHVRRTESDGTAGWGESTGTVPLEFGNLFFATYIPLSFLDDDDGGLDYQLEIYDTIERDLQGTGITHIYNASYNGSSAPVPEPATVLLLGAGLLGLAAASRRKFKRP